MCIFYRKYSRRNLHLASSTDDALRITLNRKSRLCGFMKQHHHQLADIHGCVVSNMTQLSISKKRAFNYYPIVHSTAQVDDLINHSRIGQSKCSLFWVLYCPVLLIVFSMMAIQRQEFTGVVKIHEGSPHNITNISLTKIVFQNPPTGNKCIYVYSKHALHALFGSVWISLLIIAELKNCYA